MTVSKFKVTNLATPNLLENCACDKCRSLMYAILLALTIVLLDGKFSLCDELSNVVSDETLFPTNSLINPGALFPLGGTLPTSRVHHTVVNVQDYVVVYGGYGTDGEFKEDINMFYVVNQKWSGPIFRKECCNYDEETIETMGFELDSTMNLPFIRTGFQGDIPLARAEHSAASADNKMYLFGGLTESFGYIQDLYSFDVHDLKWHLLVTESNRVPCRRAGHSMVSDEKNFVYVFGGRSSLTSNNRNYGLNDIWRYSIANNKWTNLYPASNSILLHNNQFINVPAVRQHAAMAYINDKIYIFGGVDPVNNMTYNDVWMFSPGIKTWTQLFAQGRSQTFGWIPPPLYSAHILPVPLDTYYNRNNSEISGFIVYGGIGGGGSCGGVACDQVQTVLGQAFLFSFTQNEWHSSRSVTGRNDTEIVYDTENGYVNATQWSYARLSSFVTSFSEVADVISDTGRQSAYLNEGSDEGKYIKSYALEKIVYVKSRNIFYEFGGLQYTGNASGFSEIAQQTLDSGGGILYNPLWDLVSGEQLRDVVTLPTNPQWSFPDAFINDENENKDLHFLRSFRTFSSNLKDIVLIKEDKML